MSAIDARFVGGPLDRQVRPLPGIPSSRWWLVEHTEALTKIEDVYRYGFTYRAVHRYAIVAAAVRTDGTLVGVHLEYVGEESR